MADTILKKWNSDTSQWEELNPQTTHTQIVASGTPSSSTYLRGDGTWATVEASGDGGVGLKFGGSLDLSAGTNEANAIGLDTLFSEVNYSNFGTTADDYINTYKIVNEPGWVKNGAGTQNSVAYYEFRLPADGSSTLDDAIGEEGDNTPPIQLEQGDWIVLTAKRQPTGGVRYYTFSIVNNNDPRFANYVAKSGDTITGSLRVDGSVEIGGDLEVVGNSIGFINTSFDAKIEVDDGNPNGTGAVFNFFGDGASRNATLSAEQFDGNAATTTKLATARNIALAGDVTGNANFDGSGNISITTTVANDSHNHDGRYYTESEANSRFVNSSGDTMTGGLTIDTGSSSNALVLRGTSPTISFIDEGGSDDFYLHTNSNNFYVLRDTAGADLVGTGYDSPHPLQLEGDTNIGYLFANRIFADNYHPNADKWTTARTLSLSGDASGSVSWDGSGNATLSVSVANDSHTHDGRYYTESESNSRYLARYSTSSLNVNAENGTQLFIGSTGSWSNRGPSGNNAGALFSINTHPGAYYSQMWFDTAGSGLYHRTANASAPTTAWQRIYEDDYHPYADEAGRAYPKRVGNVDLNFNWSGKSGQPPWLWGGSDGSNMYVYNPSNFSVSYANSAGNADTVDGVHESTFMRRSANSQLDMNNNDIVGVDQIIHEGDTNTYIQFHASDQWRVVTGGSERLEVNNSETKVSQNFRVTGNRAYFQATDTIAYFGHPSTSNEAEIRIDTSQAGSPQISFTEHGDMSWAIGGDDADNSFKIHGFASSTVPTINNLAVPIFELTTAGKAYVNGDEVWDRGNLSFSLDGNTLTINY